MKGRCATMTESQRIELYCRKVCNRLVYRSRQHKISPVSAAIEYLDLVPYLRYEYGYCPTMFKTYERLPEAVQNAIQRIWAEENEA